MTTTANGVAPTEFETALETDADIADAFMGLFSTENDDASKKKPSDKGTVASKKETSEDDEAPDNEEETETDADETDETDEDADKPSDEEDEGAEDEDEEDETPQKKFADDDDETYIKIKEGDTEHEVKVKDLKRLYGQEAALTRKSQEVAQKTKDVEASQAKNLAALDVLVKRAQEASKPYQQINWAALMKDPNVSADEVGALQSAARVAFENEQFLTQQLDGFMNEVKQSQAANHAKAAADCIKSLTTKDSANYIDGWSKELYNDLRSFSTEMGVHKDIVNQLTDPAAFKLLHMAMQFHKGSKKVTVTKKVNKSPKKITKSSVSNKTGSTSGKDIDRKKAVGQLKKTGSMKDAEAAFEAMFKGD